MNTKIRCLLLDDELPGLTYLKMLCEQIPQLEIVKSYNSPQQLLLEWDQLDFDLLITDIEMPGINGLQVSDVLQDKAIIFTTAYKNFAVDAFDRDAADYVVKPVKLERLQQAVQKVVERLDKKLPQIRQLQLNTDRGKALVNISRIFCIVTSDIDSRDKVILLDDNSKMIVKNYSFEKLLEFLPQTEFCRINKKVVVALKHVQYYIHGEITTDITAPDGKLYTFTLSEIYKTDFYKKVKV